MFGAFRVHRVGLFFVSPCVHPRGVPDGKRCGGLRGTAAVCIHLLHCWHVHKLLPRSRRQQRRAAGQRGPPGPTVSNRKLNWTMKNQKGVLFCFFLIKDYWFFCPRATWLIYFIISWKQTSSAVCTSDHNIHDQQQMWFIVKLSEWNCCGTREIPLFTLHEFI